jgi:hypothetical protein
LPSGEKEAAHPKGVSLEDLGEDPDMYRSVLDRPVPEV